MQREAQRWAGRAAGRRPRTGWNARAPAVRRWRLRRRRRAALLDPAAPLVKQTVVVPSTLVHLRSLHPPATPASCYVHANLSTLPVACGQTASTACTWSWGVVPSFDRADSPDAALFDSWTRDYVLLGLRM